MLAFKEGVENGRSLVSHISIQELYHWLLLSLSSQISYFETEVASVRRTVHKNSKFTDSIHNENTWEPFVPKESVSYDPDLGGDWEVVVSMAAEELPPCIITVSRAVDFWVVNTAAVTRDKLEFQRWYTLKKSSLTRRGRISLNYFKANIKAGLMVFQQYKIMK